MGGCLEGNFFLARFDEAGTAVWATSGTCFDDDGISVVVSRDMAVLADGSSLVIGEVDAMTMLGEGEPNQTSFMFETNFLALYDPDGILAWAKPIAGNNHGIAVSENAGVIATTGSFGGTTTFGQGDPTETTIEGGTGRIFVATYSLNGTFAWVAHAGN
jgi:hypothetical protein